MAANRQKLVGLGAPAPSKAALLAHELNSPELSFLMEAHDGMSAKIVQQAGFKGIWASGLSIATALGVRDSNEASWTQVLEILEFMADATEIPILVDGDTGYGNFNNVRRLVQKLCQRDIAGVCIEDKLFPKTNSFIGESQPLADMAEFCGKIKAGKDSQTDPDFCLVARVEALISGRGMEEALRRAEAYHEAGADAVLIHSKKTTAGEIVEFMERWGGRCPVVIVPTTYYSTPTAAIRDCGVSTVIWANHNLRAAMRAMHDTAREIQRDETIVGVENRIASMRDVFELAGNAELADAERRYLPATGPTARAIVLAATRGEALGRLTEDRPKCMVEIRGQPLLHRLAAGFRDSGIDDIAVVLGYRPDAVDMPAIARIDNADYATTGEAASLACAAERLVGDCVIAYGDILFRPYILDNLKQCDGDIVVAVDALWRERSGQTEVRDLVRGTRPFSARYLDDDEPPLIEQIGDGLEASDAHGEWIGLARLSPRGAELVRAELDEMAGDGTLATADLPVLFNRIARKGEPVGILYVTGHWLDVDDALDLAQAGDFL